MLEITGNLWDHQSASRICITTNGIVKADGCLVMGKGCALEAARRHPDMPRLLGRFVRNSGNHVFALPHNLVSFPTKHDWRLPSDLDLIRQSAIELRNLADSNLWKSVVIPRPGCGNGELKWPEVRGVLAPILNDDRFKIITFKGR